METNRVGDLEIEQDLEFERRSWRAERAMWGGLVLFLLAGAAGLLGNGPLSGTTLSRGAFAFEYGRFVRYGANAELEFKLAPGAMQGDKVRVWLDRQYRDRIGVRAIEPVPDSVEAAPDRYIYVFKLHQPGAAAGFLFEITPNVAGINHGRAGIEGGPEVQFRQIVWP